MLGNGGSADEAAKAVIAAGAVDELRAALPSIAEAARRPAGVTGVREALFPWFSIYPQPVRGDAEAEAFWLSYTETCGDLSTEALTAGMKAWASSPDAEFLPKPGKLRELAFTAPTPGFKLYALAHDVLTAADKRLGIVHVQARMERDKVKPESQKEAVARMLQELKDHPGFPPQPPGITYREWARKCMDEGLLRTTPRPGTKERTAEIYAKMPNTAGQVVPGTHITPEMHRVMGWPLPETQEEPVTGHLDPDYDARADDDVPAFSDGL